MLDLASEGACAATGAALKPTVTAAATVSTCWSLRIVGSMGSVVRSGFPGFTQLAEEPREVRGLVVRVQPTRVGEHPHPRIAHRVCLRSELGAWPLEGGAIRPQPEHGEPARLVSPDLCLECLPT